MKQSGFLHSSSETSQSAGACPVPGRVDWFHGGNSARNPNSKDALAGSLADLPPPAALGKQTLRLSTPYMSGADVRDAQQRLLNAGFGLPMHGVDGVFGPETASAVKAFQASNGIHANGVVGTETWMALYAVTGTSPVGSGSNTAQGTVTVNSQNGDNAYSLRKWLLLAGGAALGGIIIAKMSG